MKVMAVRLIVCVHLCFLLPLLLFSAESFPCFLANQFEPQQEIIPNLIHSTILVLFFIEN